MWGEWVCDGGNCDVEKCPWAIGSARALTSPNAEITGGVGGDGVYACVCVCVFRPVPLPQQWQTGALSQWRTGRVGKHKAEGGHTRVGKQKDIQSITSSEMCSLHLTQVHTHLEQWQPTLQRPGCSWGFGALLKGLTSVVDNSCRSRDSNPQPRVTSPTLYPLGHDCPCLDCLVTSVVTVEYCLSNETRFRLFDNTR